jgi:hypothetical protein
MRAFTAVAKKSVKPISHHQLNAMLRLGMLTAIVGGITASPAIAAVRPLSLDRWESPSKVINAASGLSNGVYLYGQSQQPNEVGQSYFVFEVREGKVLGALYMPQSSFDCAYGGFQRDHLALSVVDSYEKTVYSYGIALDRTSQVAALGQPPIGQPSLEGFQKLSQVSSKDMALLNSCKASYQAHAW